MLNLFRRVYEADGIAMRSQKTENGVKMAIIFRLPAKVAFVAVHYRDHWFWIDDRDIHSKTMFNFLMILFSFTERGKSEPDAPVITVPTN